MSSIAEAAAAEMPFVRLRAALELFGKPPSELDAAQADRAERQAWREYALESRILGAPEAAGVVAGEAEVERAYGEIAQRYPNRDALAAALAANDLDEAVLRQALSRQCRVNTVLERVSVAADQEEISETEVGIYYHSHFHSFQQPERREAFHILISINEDFPENRRDQALQRIRRLAERLQQKPQLFEELAQRHSECPTAMRGGRIGLVRRGQLFAPVETALFQLEAGAIGPPVESEVGFHLVFCKSIHKPETLSLKKATPHIRKVLRERLRENRRRAWIASLNTVPVPHPGAAVHE